MFGWLRRIFGGGESREESSVAPDPSIRKGEWQDAAVKWFDHNKGYGMLTRGIGTKDIFIHVSIIRSLNIERLEPLQKVRVRCRESTRKPGGIEAEAIQLVNE